MTTVTVTVKSAGQTVERIISRQIGRYVPGVVEKTLALNPELAGLGPILPVGTSFDIAFPSASEISEATEVVQLVD